MIAKALFRKFTNTLGGLGKKRTRKKGGQRLAHSRAQATMAQRAKLPPAREVAALGRRCASSGVRANTVRGRGRKVARRLTAAADAAATTVLLQAIGLRPSFSALLQSRIDFNLRHPPMQRCERCKRLGYIPMTPPCQAEHVQRGRRERHDCTRGLHPRGSRLHAACGLGHSANEAGLCTKICTRTRWSCG